MIVALIMLGVSVGILATLKYIWNKPLRLWDEVEELIDD